MRRIKTFIILCYLCVVCSSHVFAYDFSAVNSDGKTLFYDIISNADLTASITSPTDSTYSGCVKIPDRVSFDGKEYIVTQIGYRAFMSSGITEVIMPKTLITIGVEAFRSCSKLSTINLPDSLLKIQNYAFMYCTGLKELTIPCNVTRILEGAFNGCNNVTKLIYNAINASALNSFPTSIVEVEFGDNVQQIPNYLLYNCTGVTELDLPLSVVIIGANSFTSCSLKSITIPDNVIHIGGGAFQNCKKLSNVTLGKRLKTIDSMAFINCTSLTSIIIPDSVETISNDAFYNCPITDVQYNAISANRSSSSSTPIFNNCLKNLTIGNSVEYIPSYFVSGATYLSDIVLPNSLKQIGSFAFFNCSSLTTITIPYSVATIGEQAFVGCNKVETLNFNAKAATVSSYCSFPSSITTLNIGENVDSIPAYLGNNMNSLFSVEIPENIKYIGHQAFVGSGNLHNVTFNAKSASTSTISPFPQTLSALNFTSSVRRIPNHILYNVTGISDVAIPNTIDTIDQHAFYGCTGLTSITIPNSVTTIGISAFNGCSNLKTVILSSSLHKIDDAVFKNCVSLETINIPNSIDTIAIRSFYSCSSLTSITIPNSVTSIGQQAFYNTNLKSITIGTGVTNIGYNAFGTKTKTIWLTNTPPSGYQYAAGTINYVSNNNYSLSNVKVYPYLSSIFEVDGVKYVPVKPSERTCDAIDCAYNETAEDINVGETVSYKSVKLNVQNLNDYAFYGNTYIKKAHVSCSGNIGSYAFNGCSNLENAIIANNGAVSKNAFADCSNLQSATLGTNVTGLGDYCFSNCSKLEGIVIPTSVLSIGQSAFNGCTSMKDVELNDGLQSVQQYAFCRCSKIGKISIPKTVTNISDYAFSGCSALSTVSFEDRESTLTLGSNGSSPLFSSCPLDSVYIGGKISYPTSSNYGYSPFYRNTVLRSVVITDKETNIYDNEFYGCTSLKNITLGDGVTSIGNRAFSGCSSLESFTFGSNMQNIGEEAFSDCASVTSIISKTTVPPTCGTQALDDVNKWECVLKVPEEAVSAYQAADQWKDFFFIEGGSTSVPNVFVVDKDEQKNDTYVSSGSAYSIVDSNKSFMVQDDIENVDISYSRTFKNANWQPLYVPFDMTVTSDLLQRFSFAKFAGTYTEQDNAGNVSFFITIVRLLEGDKIKANTPYFIQAKTADASNAQTISVDGTTLHKTEEMNFSMYSAEKKLSVYGIYNQKICAYDGEYYAYSAGKYSKQLTGAKLGAFRFYVTIENREDNPYGTSSPDEIKLKVLGEDATGISDANVDVDINGNCFNLAGQVVGPDYKGIVIKNGKKMYNK